ncbi:MAG: PRC-barrel domain-containing protein [Pseudomonadota bacterium]
MKVTELIGTALYHSANESQIGTCVDVLIDIAEGKIACLLVDVGGVGNHRPVLFMRDRIDHRDGKLMADISRDELEAQRDEPAFSGPLDIAPLPPVLIGPFGNAVSPALAAALFNAGSEVDKTRRPAIDDEHAKWHWFGRLDDLQMVCDGERLGALENIGINFETLTCTHVMISDGLGHIATEPFEIIQDIPQAEDRIVVKTSRSMARPD